MCLVAIEQVYKNLELSAIRKQTELQNKLTILHDWANETFRADQLYLVRGQDSSYHVGLNKHANFCLKSDAYKILHPDVISDDLMVFREDTDLVREVVRHNMLDAVPQLEQTFLKPETNRTYDLPLQTSLLFPFSTNLFLDMQINYENGCLFQEHYHIPGQWQASAKSFLANNMANYLQSLRNMNKPQHCIEDAYFMKPTYRLWEESECRAFFAIINEEAYQIYLKESGLNFIFKTNDHLGNGILLLDHQNELLIREWYKNGTGCGQNGTHSLVQEYVRNPYLFKGRKLEFRTYFSVPSTYPPILYVHKKALLKQCALQYNVMDFSKSAHVCNTAVTKTHKTTSTNDEDLFIDWNLEELQLMLLENSLINSTNWLNDFLYPQMMRKITHLYLSITHGLVHDPRLGEYFAIDFIMDTNLQLWVLECNHNFNYLQVTDARTRKFNSLISDMIEIQSLYLRGRYKRLRKFIEEEMDELQTKDKRNEMKSKFFSLFSAKDLEEFKLSPQNGNILAFYIDLDKKIYYDQVSEECRLYM